MATIGNNTSGDSRWSQRFPRKDSPAKIKRLCLGCLWTRLWNPNPRPLSEGTSDPLRSSNTERGQAIRCAPSLDDRKHSGKSSMRQADPLRSDLARSGHRSIAISPTNMNTNGANLIDPCIVRHDRACGSGWSPRVRLAHLSRNSRLLGGQNFSSRHSPYHQTLSEID